MSKIVNGSSRQPLSGNAPQQIVLLLHGYGSDGADLISIAPHWQSAAPDALFLAPNAPEHCPMGAGYQWWALDTFTPEALAVGVVSAAPAINAFIDRKLAQYSLTDKQLVIVGFSQGTMMALHLGLHRENAVAGVVGYSGMLTGAADLTRTPRQKPPVLLIHGSADPVVPVSALHEARHALETWGVPVMTHISPNLGHSVDPVGLQLGGQFIAKAFG